MPSFLYTVIVRNQTADNKSRIPEGEMGMSIGAVIVIALVLCCCFTHRRVIRALIRHEPMPKAPGWHVWVKKENRRS